MLRGDSAKLDAIVASDEWGHIRTRAFLPPGTIGVVPV